LAGLLGNVVQFLYTIGGFWTQMAREK